VRFGASGAEPRPVVLTTIWLSPFAKPKSVECHQSEAQTRSHREDDPKRVWMRDRHRRDGCGRDQRENDEARIDEARVRSGRRS